MENLLKWSVAASKGGANNVPPPDPKALSQLFGAPDDVTLMKEELRNVVDNQDREQRLISLENFRDHVENIDNANNIGALWEPLIYTVQDKDSEISAMALSCIGAAVQNNDKAQGDLVKTKALKYIVAKLTDSDANVAKRALFALSCAIAHCPDAYDQFVEAKGWSILKQQIANINSLDEQAQGRVLALIYAIALLMGERSIYNELKETDLVNILNNIKANGFERSKERAVDILNTIDEHPQKSIKLLGD